MAGTSPSAVSSIGAVVLDLSVARRDHVMEMILPKRRPLDPFSLYAWSAAWTASLARRSCLGRLARYVRMDDCPVWCNTSAYSTIVAKSTGSVPRNTENVQLDAIVIAR